MTIEGGTPLEPNGNGTGRNEVEEQFNLWREEMPRLVRDLLESVMPGMIESAIEKTLQEKFVPRAELEEMFEVQRHVADEKYALQTTVSKLQVENAELRGRLNAVEKTVQTNTSSIEGLKRFVETTLGSIQSSVASVQQIFQSTSQTLTQSLQTVIDRQNAQTARYDALEKRVTIGEGDLDKVRETVRAAETVNEDLRGRLLESIPPLRDAVFGGHGQDGLVMLVKAQAAASIPIVDYIAELKRRDETRRQQLEMAKATAVHVLKNWKTYAVALGSGSGIAVLYTILQMLSGGN